MRAQLRAHPCHGCSDREDHARWAERYFRLDRENREVQRKIEQRTNTIARQFDRVCQVLDALHYLDGDKTTEAGDRLSRIYTELDLVAAECLRQGVRRPHRARAGRVSCRAGLRGAVEGRADVATVAARRRTPGAGADGWDLARPVRAGAGHASRLPAVDGPRLLLAGVPVGIGCLAGRGALRVRPGRGRLRSLGQAAHRPAPSRSRTRPADPLRITARRRSRPDPSWRDLVRIDDRRAVDNPCGERLSVARTPCREDLKENTSVELSRRNLGKLAVATGAVAAAGTAVGTRRWPTRRCRLDLADDRTAVSALGRFRQPDEGLHAGPRHHGRAARGHLQGPPGACPRLQHVDRADVSLTSLFRVASLTKSFTAAAILKLVQDGKLSLSTPVT